MSDDVVAQHMRLVRAMSRENEPLSSRGRTATVRNPRWYTPQGEPTPRRNALREELVAVALARSPGTSAVIAEGAQQSGQTDLAPLIGASDGRPRAVVMAGPPGAGKSTVRAQLLGAEADAWMVIDADALHDVLARGGAGPGEPIQLVQGLAYVMILVVPGRDQEYMLVHHRLPGSDTPVIAFCGPKA